MKAASRLTTERSSVMTTRRRRLKCDVQGNESRGRLRRRYFVSPDDDEGVRDDDDGDGPRLGDVDVRPRPDGDAMFSR